MSENIGLKALYIQAADMICQEIKKCNFREGERLPRINQLARMMKVNSSAMERGLSYLEEEKILSRDAASVYRVEKGAVNCLKEKDRIYFLEHRLPDFLKEAGRLGISREMILEYLNKEENDEHCKLS